MLRKERKRRSRDFVFEGLEPRNLMTGLPTNQEILGITAESLIKGTIQAAVTSSTPIHGSTSSFHVTYTGQGSTAKLGQVSLTGQHNVTLSTIGRSSLVSYGAGKGTLVTSAGNISISYTGSGHMQRNGNYASHITGTGIGVSGLIKGTTVPITGQIRGSARTGLFTISFVIG